MIINGKFLLAAAALVALSSAGARAEELKMQTFLGPTATNTKIFQATADELKAATNGAIDIKVFPGGAVVPQADAIDAINAGLLAGQYSAPTYFAGKNPAMGILGDPLAIYPDADVRDRWFTEGGGLAVARKLYDQQGLFFICHTYWPLEQLPSTKPITGVDGFKGMKIRSPGGTSADLLSLAGASLVTMSLGDSLTALETGALDAADGGGIGLNMALGMYNKAKYSIVARHSMGIQEMSVSKTVWNKISAENKTKFEAACNTMRGKLRTAHLEEDAAAEKKAIAEGVTIIRFSGEDEKRFRAMTLEVWKKWGARSAIAQEIVDSQTAFLKKLNLL